MSSGAASGPDAELVSLRRSFRIGMVAVAAFLIAVGGVVAAFGSRADRPAGIAERWLVALSDTTRDGLEDDARDRMEEHQFASGLFLGIGPLDAFPELQDDRGAAEDGEPRFDTVQVGRPVRDGVDDGYAMVPVEVTPYEADDPLPGYVLMFDGSLVEAGLADPEAAAATTDDGGWHVIAFGSPAGIEDLGAFAPGTFCPDGRCPGFPLERPDRAPIGFWLGTLAIGVLIAAGCSLAARAATPKPRPAAGAPAAS